MLLSVLDYARFVLCSVVYDSVVRSPLFVARTHVIGLCHREGSVCQVVNVKQDRWDLLCDERAQMFAQGVLLTHECLAPQMVD